MTSSICGRLLDELGAYLDGDVAAATCAEIERHLAECENCRVVVDTMRKTISLYRDQAQSALPDAARQRLYMALDLDEFYKECR